METVTYVFIAVLATLGSLIVGNDIALWIQHKTSAPFLPVFIALLVGAVGGAVLASRFGNLFWYAGIIALFGSCYALAGLGMLGR